MRTTDEMIDRLFDNLDKWRHLPSYQLERRADIFFSLYLKDIIHKELPFKVKDILIPEFPLRKGTVFEKYKDDNENKNRSYKVDYLAISTCSKKSVLIELKTDTKSINTNQNEYLKSALEVGFKTLLDGVITLYRENNSYKKKYECLLKLLESAELVKFNSNGVVNNSEEDIQMHLLFIQPNDTDNNNNLEKKIVTFENLRKWIQEKYKDDLTERFATSLENWGKNSAGDCFK